MIIEGFVQKCLKNGLLTCTFQLPNGNLAPPPMISNKINGSFFLIIVAFLENATIGYSLESLCVCVCVCVCVFAR